MKEKEIKKAAKKFIKSLKGKVDFVETENYLKSIGYEVIFFNTPIGDKEILRYDLTRKANSTNGFTYTGTAKIVFINGECPNDEKLYLLYHEMGHILLKHLSHPHFALQNRVLLDIEADVFAYNIIRQSKINFTLVFFWIAVALLLVSHFIPIETKDNIVPAVAPTEKTSATPPQSTASQARPSGELSPQETERAYVLITPTGEKYHRSNCRYVNGKSCTQLTETEAQKNYSPCSVCNP